MPEHKNGKTASDWMIVHHAVGVVMELSDKDNEYKHFSAIVSRGDVSVTFKHKKGKCDE